MADHDNEPVTGIDAQATSHENFELTVGIDREGKPVKITLIEESEAVEKLFGRYQRDATAQSRHGKSNLLTLQMIQELIWQGREKNLPAWGKLRCRGAACSYCRGLPGGCPSED